MLDKSLIFILILITVLSANAVKRKPYTDNPWDNPSEQECSDRIHRKCTHLEPYTEEDVERARIWIQKRFAKTNPQIPACETLHVRKDIKCMSQTEIDDVVTVILQLYADGTMTRMAKLHYDYWGVEHKFIEGAYWHWWFVNELELKMREINHNVSMPYWDVQGEFTGAEKSKMWDIFGRAGNASNDYCITGSRFEGKAICGFPTTHCVRRQWNADGTIPVWEPTEWVTAAIQIGFTPEILTPGFLLIFQFLSPELLANRLNLLLTILAKNICPTQLYFNWAVLSTLDSHFKTHLAIGGWLGDVSVRWAPCDIVFYIFHEGLNMYFRKWQLQSDENLVPESWSLGLRSIPSGDPICTNGPNCTYNITATDINVDTLAYYNATLRENFQFTYGKQCYIHDRFIKPINDIIKKKKAKLPIAYYRLKEALPKDLFQKYFPKFANCPEDVSYFDYVFDDVGNCNQKCRRMPIASNYTSTANGLRQWNVFADETVGGIDTTVVIGPGEGVFWKFMQDLNKYGYCSQYA